MTKYNTIINSVYASSSEMNETIETSSTRINFTRSSLFFFFLKRKKGKPTGKFFQIGPSFWRKNIQARSSFDIAIRPEREATGRYIFESIFWKERSDSRACSFRVICMGSDRAFQFNPPEISYRPLTANWNSLSIGWNRPLSFPRSNTRVPSRLSRPDDRILDKNQRPPLPFNYR